MELKIDYKISVERQAVITGPKYTENSKQFCFIAM